MTSTGRHGIAVILSGLAGAVLFVCAPFPRQLAVLRLVSLQKPLLYSGLQCGYAAMLFSTPYLFLSWIASAARVVSGGNERPLVSIHLPPFPTMDMRDKLSLIIGEVHFQRKPEPATNPHWFEIPDRALFTGIVVLGAIGSGKTSGCILPFADQILGYKADDGDRRIGGLVLDVKGDMCRKVSATLEKHGRGEDYVELNLHGEYRYNPLAGDQDAYALAFSIASLMNNLFGRSREPFWQQAYTNLVRFVILLHQTLFDYVTLFDVYECAINPQLLEERIIEGEKRFGSEYLSIDIDTFQDHPALDNFEFAVDHKAKRMRAPYSIDLRLYLESHRCSYVTETVADAVVENPIADDRKKEQFESVKRWFYHDWRQIEPKLRTSIIEGISVFLASFDSDPDVKRVFCPPKTVFDHENDKDGKYGKPLPPWSELINTGKVVMLNLPVSANPALAKILGTLLKLDFERAVLNRIPSIEEGKEGNEGAHRPVLFLCDEYQIFATVGEQDPAGDEKFFALSRQAKCIPIIATQSISSLRATLPGESWRALLQTFRTKIFLTLSDDFSADLASRYCGKEEMLKPTYSLSENGQDANISMFTGKASAKKSGLTAGKSYATQILPIFESRAFTELKNAQAIVLGYDGCNPLPPTLCYLKPDYLDTNTSYFEQVAKGKI